MRNILKKLAALALVVVGATSSHAQDKVIRMGTMNWEDLTPITLISKKFLEKQGYKVESTSFSEWGIAYGALSKGDVDILASQINYAAGDYWAKNKNRLEKISVVSHGLLQGVVVPSYMPIDSIDQLNDVKDKVGGRIIGIEPGSGLMRELGAAVKEYGLKYQVVDGSTAATMAQLQSSLERKQPIVTVMWKPSWMAQKYDVKFLKDPKNVFAPAQSYYWVAKKGFSAKNPRAREALASIFVPVEDITKISSDVNDGKTLEQAVDLWWGKNSSLIERWSVMASN